MVKQQCPNCAAPIELSNNQDGSGFFKCSYCGNIVNVQNQQRPQTALGKAFSIVNQLIPNNRDINTEKERLLSIINDPLSTKDAVKYAKKELKRLNNERSGRY